MDHIDVLADLGLDGAADRDRTRHRVADRRSDRSQYGAGWLADRWFKQGRKDAHLRVMMYSAPLMLVASAALPLMPTPELALLMFAPHILGAAGITAAGGAALMLITPESTARTDDGGLLFRYQPRRLDAGSVQRRVHYGLRFR